MRQKETVLTALLTKPQSTQHRIQRPGRGGGPRNMKSMWPPLAAIFFMTCFYRARGGGAWPPRPPPWIRYCHRSAGGWNDPQKPFHIDGFMAFSGIVSGKAGNSSASGFLNSTVSYRLFAAKMPPAGITLRHHSPIYRNYTIEELYQSNHGTARNREGSGIVNSAVKQFNGKT